VDAREARQLVARGRDPLDRRGVTVEVTTTGHDLLAAVRDRRRHTTIGMLGRLSEEELRTLGELLGRIVE